MLRSFFIRTLPALFWTCLFSSAAWAQEVELSGDTGRSGELRTTVESAGAGERITFAPGVQPVLTGTAVRVGAAGLLLSGNPAGAATPATTIRRDGSPAEAVLMSRDGRGNGLSMSNLVLDGVVRAGGSSPISGGGLVGAVNEIDNAGASLGAFVAVQVTEARVSAANHLTGGGLFGAASATGAAAVGGLDRATGFRANRVELTNTASAETGRIWGAGLVGAFAYAGTATVGDLDASFHANIVSTATYINGAGLAGAMVVSGDHAATVGAVRGDYRDNLVQAATNLSGGGLVGSWSSEGLVAVGDVDGTFTNNRVLLGTSYLRGGGIVGLRSYSGAARLGTVRGSFIGNRIEVGTNLGGGGIIGLYTADTLAPGMRGNDKSATLAGFDGARFLGNRVDVGHADADDVYALGGVAAATGLDAGLTIRDTVFRDNALSITGRSVVGTGGGALYVGTDRLSADSRGHAVTLTAAPGNATEFRNNTVAVAEAGRSALRRNAIHFGREWDGGTRAVLDSRADATLDIQPEAGGRVLLLDPLSVDMNNGRTFTMTVAGPGFFLWDGLNPLSADTATLRFAGGVTELGPSFQATNPGGVFAVRLEATHTLRANLTGRDGDLAMFQTPDAFAVDRRSELSGAYYGLDATRGREWLLTDQRGTVAADAFALPERDGFATTLRSDGANLYLGLDNTEAIAPFAAASSANVRAAYGSGALARAWDGYLAGLDADLMEPAFRRARDNPRILVAESVATQALVALRMHGGIADTALASGGFLSNAVTGKGYEDCVSPRFRFWADYLGNWSRMDSADGFSGYDARLDGVVLGGTFSPGDGFDWGLYGAYARADTDYDRLAADNDANLYQAGLMARWRPTDAAAVVLDLPYTRFDNDSSRHAVGGGYRSEFNQDVLGLGLTATRVWSPGAEVDLAPYASLRYSRLWQERVREQGATSALAQRVDAFDADAWTGRLGVRISRETPLGERLRLAPALHGAWKHEFGDRDLHTRARYAAASQRFDLSSARIRRDTAEIGLDLVARVLTDSVYVCDFRAGYALEANGSFTDQRLHLGLGLSF